MIGHDTICIIWSMLQLAKENMQKLRYFENLYIVIQGRAKVLNNDYEQII